MQAKGMGMHTIDVDDVRKIIANEIRTNLYIKNVIENGYHRYYISQLGFGGKKLPNSQRQTEHPTEFDGPEDFVYF